MDEPRAAEDDPVRDLQPEDDALGDVEAHDSGDEAEGRHGQVADAAEEGGHRQAEDVDEDLRGGGGRPSIAALAPFTGGAGTRLDEAEREHGQRLEGPRARGVHDRAPELLARQEPRVAHERPVDPAAALQRELALRLLALEEEVRLGHPRRHGCTRGAGDGCTGRRGRGGGEEEGHALRVGDGERRMMR